MATARVQFGLAFSVELVGHWCDVRVLEERADEVRRSVLGRARFGKGEAKKAVLEWARGQGLDSDDDNRADALMLWHHACALHQKGKIRL